MCQETGTIALGRNDRFLSNSSGSGVLQASTAATSRSSSGDGVEAVRLVGGEPLQVVAPHVSELDTRRGSMADGGDELGWLGARASRQVSSRDELLRTWTQPALLRWIEWEEAEQGLDDGPRTTSLSSALHGGNLTWLTLPPRRYSGL
jgi:hypothetical protein